MKIHDIRTSTHCPCLLCNIFVQAINKIFDYATHVEFLNKKSMTMHDQFLIKLSGKDNIMSEQLENVKYYTSGLE